MSQPKIMRGATDVRNALVMFLPDALEPVVDQFREDYDLDEYLLPMFTHVYAYAPTNTESYPSLAIDVARADEFSREIDGSYGAHYRPEYTVRLYLFVATPMDENKNAIENKYEQCLRLRDDLAAVVRATVLRTPTLGNGLIHFDESSLIEEYSEPVQITGGKWAAVAQISLTLKYDESVALPPIGTANDIDVDVYQIGDES